MSTNEYFPEPNAKEAQIRKLCSFIDERKALLDFVEDSDSTFLYGMDDPSFTPRTVLSLDLKSGEQLKLRPLAKGSDGVLVRNEQNGENLFLKGSVYLYSPKDINDEYAYSIFKKAFIGKILPHSLELSDSLSVPLVSARGIVGAGGHLVFCRVYDFEQAQSAIEQGAITKGTEYYEIQQGPLDGGMIIPELEYNPNTVANIDLIPDK